MITGIYKITNPHKKVYIGSSKNINKRFSLYKGLHCKAQTKLYRSLKKYGVENHIFEIIEECEFELLYLRERYWQEYYDCVDNGLNCHFTKTSEKPRELSNNTKIKISNSHKGKKLSEETKLKMKNVRVGKKLNKSVIDKMIKNRKNIYPVKCIKTGKIFENVKQAALYLNVNPTTLYRWLNNIHKNKSSMIYIKNITKL